MIKPNNAVALHTSLDNFFSYWVQFMQPIHHLNKKQMKVLACLLKHHYQYSLKVNSESYISSLLFSKECLKEVQKESGMTSGYLNVTMTKLRKAQIITPDKRINPVLIPHLKNDSERGMFNLMVLFQIDDTTPDIQTGS